MEGPLFPVTTMAEFGFWSYHRLPVSYDSVNDLGRATDANNWSPSSRSMVAQQGEPPAGRPIGTRRLDSAGLSSWIFAGQGGDGEKSQEKPWACKFIL